MCEAIHTSVCRPPTVEGGDGYTLQEVKLIASTLEAPHADALILGVMHCRGGQEIFPPRDDIVDTVPTTDRQCINIALQISRDQADQMSGARLQLSDGPFKVLVHPLTAPRILATASLRNVSSRSASCSNACIASSGTLCFRSA
jgi:hypothetical protein